MRARRSKSKAPSSLFLRLRVLRIAAVRLMALAGRNGDVDGFTLLNGLRALRKHRRSLSPVVGDVRAERILRNLCVNLREATKLLDTYAAKRGAKENVASTASHRGSRDASWPVVALNSLERQHAHQDLDVLSARRTITAVNMFLLEFDRPNFPTAPGVLSFNFLGLRRRATIGELAALWCVLIRAPDRRRLPSRPPRRACGHEGCRTQDSEGPRSGEKIGPPPATFAPGDARAAP